MDPLFLREEAQKFILNDDILNNEQISFSIFTLSPRSFLSTSFIDGEKKQSKQRSSLCLSLHLIAFFWPMRHKLDTFELRNVPKTFHLQ